MQGTISSTCAGAAAQRSVNDGLGWLFSALDIVTPSIYLGIPGLPNVTGAAAYVTSTVDEALRLAAAAGKEVFPVVWLAYDDYWRVPAPTDRELLAPRDLQVELGKGLNAGCAGLLIWGHADPGDNGSLGREAMRLYAGPGGPLAKSVGVICEEFHCEDNSE